MAEYIEREAVLKHLDECKGEPSELCYTYALYRSVEHVVRDIPAADVAEVKLGEWIETKKHLWRKDEYGEIDEFAWEHAFHNGPVCEVCGRTPCIHCKPDYDKDESCYGHYVCSVCGRHEKEKEPFCPNCGAKMKG